MLCASLSCASKDQKDTGMPAKKPSLYRKFVRSSVTRGLELFFKTGPTTSNTSPGSTVFCRTSETTQCSCSILHFRGSEKDLTFYRPCTAHITAIGRMMVKSGTQGEWVMRIDTGPTTARIAFEPSKFSIPSIE